jgi:hypothetical protein
VRDVDIAANRKAGSESKAILCWGDWVTGGEDRYGVLKGGSGDGDDQIVCRIDGNKILEGGSKCRVLGRFKGDGTPSCSSPHEIGLSLAAMYVSHNGKLSFLPQG